MTKTHQSSTTFTSNMEFPPLFPKIRRDFTLHGHCAPTAAERVV